MRPGPRQARRPPGRSGRRPACGQAVLVAEAGDRDVDEPWVQAAHDLLGEPQPGDDPRPEVLNENVRGGYDPFDDLDAFGPLEVDRDRAFAAVVVHEWRGQGPALAPESPHLVAAVGALDLDDVRALVTEQHGRERARDHCRQIDDPDPRQRSGHDDSSRLWPCYSKPHCGAHAVACGPSQSGTGAYISGNLLIMRSSTGGTTFAMESRTKPSIRRSAP